jgi:Homeodomain-like domain
MGTDEAGARREAAARLRAKALKMRREGASLESIGTRLGVTRATARRLVARELSALSTESGIDERRLLHADVLMELWRSLYPAAVSGDPEAVDRFLRVEERISRLLGLDVQPKGNGDRSAGEARREERVLVDG